jgi:hypothetical protein
VEVLHRVKGGCASTFPQRPPYTFLPGSWLPPGSEGPFRWEFSLFPVVSPGPTVSYDMVCGAHGWRLLETANSLGVFVPPGGLE